MQNKERVKREIERLVSEHDGLLPPSALVNAARPDDSILHSLFEWDDTVAAEKWRLDQARQILRVIVTIEGPKDKQQVTRAFVSLTTDRVQEGGGYRRLVDVLSQEEYRSQLVADALEDLQRWRMKYAKLTELAEIFAAADIVSEQQRQTTTEAST